MIEAKHWNDRNFYYVQTNNPTEEILRKRHIELNREISFILDHTFWCTPEIKQQVQKKINSYLESCGGSSAATCCGALGYFDGKPEGPDIGQLDEQLVDWLNDPRNYDDMREAFNQPWADPAMVMGNRVPYFYPLAVKRLWNADCSFHELVDDELVRTALLTGNAVQVCLKEGHFIPVVHLDTETDEFIYNDPWPWRVPEWNGDGFNRKMKGDDFYNSIKPWCLIYYPPKEG